MPEKTRDRKNWFPRFKSNWLGTYRSKQMFMCCECAVTDAESARYKGAEGKHCACGRDQWHLAKSVEEAEYNRRMEISKSYGGIRYEEALERIKSMGGHDYTHPEYDDKRVRCESDESSTSTASMHSTDSLDYHVHKRMKTDPSLSPASSRSGAYPHELKLSMGPAPTAYSYDPPTMYKPYASTYTPLGVDTLGASPYDHLAPPTFTDEESFGELLQGILEDDPRNVHSKLSRPMPPSTYSYASHLKRYAPESSLPPPPSELEMEFYHQPGPSHLVHPSSYGYYAPPLMPVATASFPSAV